MTPMPATESLQCRASVARVPCLLLVMALILSLAACGFQMRGAPQLPPEMDVVYIKADDPFSPLVRELRRMLEGDERRVTWDEDEAGAVIEILQARSRTQTLAVNLQGRPEELRVSYEVIFRVTANGETLVGREEMRIERDIAADPDDTLGSRQEARRVGEILEEDMVGRIMMRIEAVTRERDS